MYGVYVLLIGLGTLGGLWLGVALAAFLLDWFTVGMDPDWKDHA